MSFVWNNNKTKFILYYLEDAECLNFQLSDRIAKKLEFLQILSFFKNGRF